MNQRASWLFALGVTLLGAGCGPAEFQNPLSDPASAKADARLEGNWISVDEDDDKAMMRISGVDATTMELVMDTKDEPLRFRMFLTQLEGKTYMNLRSPTPESADIGRDYILARYELAEDGNTMSLRLMREEFLKDAIDKGKLRGTTRGDGSGKILLITESTETLAKFVSSSDAEQLFDQALQMRKTAAP